jgi:hypothetical protein
MPQELEKQEGSELVKGELGVLVFLAAYALKNLEDISRLVEERRRDLVIAYASVRKLDEEYR